MTSLKDAAISFKNEKKDVTTLPSIPVDIEVKEGTFEKNGKEMKYKFVEVNGWKYSIKASLLEKIQQILSVRPTTKNIKIEKAPNGDMFVIPLD